MNHPIITHFSDSILYMLDALFHSRRNDVDVRYFFNILKGQIFKEGSIMQTIRIGSSLRLFLPNEPIKSGITWKEFIVDLKACATSFSFSAKIFHNHLNDIEEFKYSINLREGLIDYPTNSKYTNNGHHGRKAEQFMEEIMQLIKLNYNLGIESWLIPVGRNNEKSNKQT